MRKNTARHWLHAGLDLLPLILIPVFMIYSHRHTIDSGSIEVPVNKVVDFNQLYNAQNYNGDNVVTTFDNDVQRSFSVGGNEIQYFNSAPRLNVYENHKYLFRVFIYENDGDSPNQFALLNTNMGVILSNSLGLNEGIVTSQYTINTSVGFVFTSAFNCDFTYNSLIFDLTQMFGAGNEPTLQQFNTWYSDNYYQYTLSNKQLLKGYSTQTYDDTDIMSQFTYQLYNSVDKYFNMGNVFGMSNVYDWFNLNIFGGNASISIYIVWNIVLYEFVMDLLFLLYALFMWFIDVTKRLIEKPLDSIK